MILHLDAGRDTPTVTLDKAEHVAETLHHQHLVFLAPVACPNHTLAHHIVCIIGMHPLLRVAQLASQVHIVHRNLRQAELPAVTMYMRHLLV